MKKLLLIVILVFFVGVGLSLAVDCPKCKVKAPEGANFCSQCGGLLPGGKILDPTKQKFCNACGKTVEMPKVSVQPTTPAPPKAGKVCKDIPEANKLYEQGLKWKAEKGTFKRKEFYVNAINSWRELIEKYPESDKCADAAFLAADLYDSIYIRDYQQAVKYYEIALSYNPAMKNDVRYRLAVIYDDKLKDFNKARPAYEAVINNNAGYEDEPKHKEKASKRIAELKALGH